MESNGIKRYSLSKQVADKLESMIISGEYKVGEKINSESELMAMFNVSRNTLREAIHSLTSAGVLDVRQGDGTYVKANNRFNANMKLEYEKVELSDIKETRNALEITLASLATKRRTDDDIKKIEEALTRRKELKEVAKENTRTDMEFHLAIAQASHNKILIDLYISIFDYLENLINEIQEETVLSFEEIDNLHESLFQAIKSGDNAAARNCVQNILNIM